MAIRVDHVARIAGIAGAVLALSASAASARPALLWGCHGPLGQPLGTAGLVAEHSGDGVAVPADGCAATSGLTASFTRADPTGGSSAAWTAAVPAGTTLTGVRLVRTLRAALGPDGASVPQRYAARAGDTTLESADLLASPSMGTAAVAVGASGSTVSVGVGCPQASGQRCRATEPGAVSLDAIALEADDGRAPQGSLRGLHSPARGVVSPTIDASDDGVGLASAQAILDGQPWAQAALDPACTDLDAGTPVPDIPLTRCAPSAAGVPLRIDISALSIGPHHLVVRLSDAAGNQAAIYDGSLTVATPDPPLTATVQLKVGDPRQAGPTPSTAASASRPTSQCAYPRLSVLLDQRPLRISHGHPVLRSGGRYRFRGRLTCRVGSIRRGAPRGTPIELLNRIGRRVRAVTGATTATGGRITMILAYRSSRTLIFRHRAVTGTSEVRIPILVAHRSRR